MATSINLPQATVDGAAKAHGPQSTQGQNPWLAYFGPSNGPIVTDAYDKYAEQNYDLPEAYKGKNLYLSETITGLVTDAQKPDFYTTVLLPWQHTDQINFSWNEFHFNETLAGRVPHEGISRLVTSSKRARSDKSVRRGIAMVLEHGFMGTSEGQEHYRRNLLGIAQCVQETANHDVMAAIFSCDNYDREWEASHGVMTDGIRRAVNEEVYAYARLQKQANGLDIAIEDAKKRMKRYGVTPDTLVIPPKVAIYLTMVRPEKTQYWLAGPTGAKNLRAGPDAMTSFRGLNVFETRSFDVYSGETPVDLGLRRRQVGEFYPVIDSSTTASIKERGGYDSTCMSTILYDESVDNWRRIDQLDMIRKCGRYRETDLRIDFTPYQEQQGGPFIYPNDSSGEAWKAVFNDKTVRRNFDIKVARPRDPEIRDSQIEITSFAAFGTNKKDQCRRNFASIVFDFKTTSNHADYPKPPDPFYSNLNVATDKTKSYRASTTISGFSIDHVMDETFSERFAQTIIESGPGVGYFRKSKDEGYTQNDPGHYHVPYDERSELEKFGYPNGAIKFTGAKLTNGDSMQQLCSALFSPHAQSAEYQQLFLGAPVPDSQPIATADQVLTVNEMGYTGHPGLHFSYSGLQLIREQGAPHHADAARRIENYMKRIANICAIGMPGLARYASSILPPNYQTSSCGRNRVKVNAQTLGMSVLFQMLTESKCGHSLTPVNADGTVNKIFAKLRGDSIVCPAYAVGHFTRSRGGVSGALGITNVGIKAHVGQIPHDQIMHDPVWHAEVGSGFEMRAYSHLSAQVTNSAQRSNKRNRTQDNQPEAVNQRQNSMASALVSQMPMVGNKNGQFEERDENFPTEDYGTKSARFQDDDGGPAIAFNGEEIENLAKDWRFKAQQRGYEDPHTKPRGHFRYYQGVSEGDHAFDEAFYNLAYEVYTTNMEQVKQKVHRHITMKAKDKKEGQGSHVELKTVASIMLLCPVDDRKSLETYVNLGYPLPFTFLLSRPFIEHQMQTLICMKSGGDTGHSYYGHNSVTVGDDAISKMHYVNLTFYSKAVVREHKHIYRLEDAYAAGYCGGNDCSFFSSREEVLNSDYTSEETNGHSMFSMVIGHKESRNMPNPIDITGSFGGVLDKDNHYKQRHVNGQHFMSAPYYSAYFHLNEVSKGDQKRQYATPRFSTDLRPANTMCFQGTQWNYNHSTSKFDIEVTNTGHWGPTFPGVRAVREGQQKHLETGFSARLPVSQGSSIAPVYS